MYEKFVLRLALRLVLPRLRSLFHELSEMQSRTGYVRVRLDCLMVDILLILNGGSNDLKEIMGDKAANAWARMCGEETRE